MRTDICSSKLKVAVEICNREDVVIGVDALTGMAVTSNNHWGVGGADPIGTAQQSCGWQLPRQHAAIQQLQQHHWIQPAC